MFSFLKKKPKAEQTHLVCLVTSYAVSAAVVKVFAKKGSVQLPVVAFSCQSVIPLRHGRDQQTLEWLVAESMMQVLNQCRAHAPAYDAVSCVLGEPWTTSVTRTAHLEKREAFVVMQSIIDEVIARETKRYEQDAAREYADREPMVLLETSVPLVDVNGYRTDQYLGSHISTLDAHLVYSAAPVRILDVLLGAFADAFHRTDVRFLSADIAKAQILRAYDRGTIVDMGGMTTAISIRENASPAYFASIPVGLAAFDEAMMLQFDISQKKIAQVLSFVHDENILDHDKEVYYARIAASYREIASVMAPHIAGIKRHIQRFEEPVVLIGQPEWLRVLGDLIEQDIGTSIIVPERDLFKDQLCFGHDAHVVNNPLSLAILHATRN